MQICQSKIHTYILKFIKKSFSLFTLEDCLVYQKNLVLYTKRTKKLNFRINFTIHVTQIHQYNNTNFNEPYTSS